MEDLSKELSEISKFSVAGLSSCGGGTTSSAVVTRAWMCSGGLISRVGIPESWEARLLRSSSHAPLNGVNNLQLREPCGGWESEGIKWLTWFWVRGLETLCKHCEDLLIDETWESRKANYKCWLVLTSKKSNSCKSYGSFFPFRKQTDIFSEPTVISTMSNYIQYSVW